MERFIIAVQEDHIVHPNGEQQSFSERWLELGRKAGHDMREVDAFSPHFFRQMNGCHGFMWRFGYPDVPRVFAKRLLPALEQGMGIAVFPDTYTAWHFEDKIAQYLLLSSSGAQQPDTRVLWNRDEAIEFCETTAYPFVLKLAHGYQSTNVRLVQNPSEAKAWVREMFGPGLTSLRHSPGSLSSRWIRRGRAAARLMLGLRTRGGADFSHGYFYAQEFLPDNPFDTRITIVGHRAFGFRRFNRDGDFRASGSGKIDWDPNNVDLEAVRVAFLISHQLHTQVAAIDVLRKSEVRLIGEISYTGASWAIARCPGHWRLRGDPGTGQGQLEWTEGHMRLEDAIFEDFIAKLRSQAAPEHELGDM